MMGNKAKLLVDYLLYNFHGRELERQKHTYMDNSYSNNVPSHHFPSKYLILVKFLMLTIYHNKTWFNLANIYWSSRVLFIVLDLVKEQIRLWNNSWQFEASFPMGEATTDASTINNLRKMVVIVEAQRIIFPGRNQGKLRI